MTPRLADMNQAMAYNLRCLVEAAPPRQRLNVEQLTRLEAADYDDQLRACESDAQREVLSRRWLRAFNP